MVPGGAKFISSKFIMLKADNTKVLIVDDEQDNWDIISKSLGDVALSHERWDGTGYPRGLHGTLIPESARIVSVADVYDSLTHQRPCRRALDQGRALAVMNACREGSFDPKICDYFVTLLPQIRRIQEEVKDEERPFVQ